MSSEVGWLKRCMGWSWICRRIGGIKRNKSKNKGNRDNLVLKYYEGGPIRKLR